MIGVIALACIGAIAVGVLSGIVIATTFLWIAKHLCHALDDSEGESPELCGFFIVPEIDSIHNGGVNSK